MKKKSKTHKVTLEFDSKDSADGFFAAWLDGGLDGGGNLDWDTEEWDDKNSYMRISGTGYPIVWNEGKMYIENNDGECIEVGPK